MRKLFLSMISASMLISCSGSKSGGSVENASSGDSISTVEMENEELATEFTEYEWPQLPLPISKTQLVKDFTLASYSWGEAEDLPHTVMVVDLDQDGISEILVREENTVGGGSAILFYDKDYKLKNFYYVIDGYYELAIKEPIAEKHEGRFTMMWDDHMGENRCFTTYYFKVVNSDYVNFGMSTVQLSYDHENDNYNSEETFYMDEEEAFEATSFSYLKNWVELNLTDDEKAAADEVSESDTEAFFSDKKPENIENEVLGLSGKIGTYPITMFIYTNEGDDNYGYYYYNSRPESRFTLKCVQNDPHPDGYNDIVLEEYTESGKNTGIFKGRLNGRGGGFTGTFTNSKGKTFDVNLDFI